MTIIRHTIIITAICTLAACDSGQETERARAAAHEFWAATKAGDVELAKGYILEGNTATLEPPEEGGSPFGEYSLGEVELDRDRALVPTTITDMDGLAPGELEFKTVLVKRNHVWWVDLDNTMGDMMQVMLGINLEQIGEAMGEAMGQAMEGMAEAMNEAMRQAQPEGRR